MLDKIREERIKKLEILREKGIDPYPNVTNRDHSLKQILDDFESFEKEGKKVIVAGRIMSLREHGALVFFDIFDGTERMQMYMKSDEISEDVFSLFNEVVDQSDIVEVTGKAFLTKRGQQSIMVENWKMLSKSIRPVPDEWYGLKDEDERYRKRYIDMLLNSEVADIVRKRSLFWNTIRSFMLNREFIEVETPVLENTTGGADAEPFVTHHNALDMDVYLRISAGELWQKELMVGGIPKTFEIGRIFRNEGMSAEHLQDYTQMEYYEAFSDYRKGMEMIKDLYRDITEKVFGTTVFEIGEFKVDFKKEWEIYDYNKLINDEFGVDPRETDIKEVTKALDDAKIKYDKKTLNVSRGVDLLWKQLRKTLAGPGFLINVPVYMEPLAKKSTEDDRVVERFQIILAGSEMGKGFSELNDPIDQRERFEHQQKMRDEGDVEAQMADMDFVEALEYGMPPTFGFGMSERLFSFLMNKNVRETQLFPLMKPRQ